MNQIGLIGLFYSKQKIRELIVLLQLIVMAVFFAYSADPLISYYQARFQMDQCYQNRYADTLYFNAGMNLQMEGTEELYREVYDRISATTEEGKIFRFANLRAIYGEDGSHVCNLIIYDHLDEIVSLKIHEGELKKEVGQHYVLVTAGIGKYYPIGSTIEAKLPDMDCTVQCIVSGILKEQCVIPILGSFGSYGSPDVFIASQSHQQPFEVILSFDLKEELGSIVPWEPNYMIVPKQGTDIKILQNKLEKEVGVFGSVLEMDSIIKESVKAVIIDNAPFVFQLVLYALVALFGYGGYIFLTIETKKKVFQELHLLGTIGYKMFFLYFVSNFMLLLIACIIGMLGKSLANGIYAHMEFSVGSWSAFIVLLCMMTGILLLASMIGYWHIRRNMVIGRKEDRGE